MNRGKVSTHGDSPSLHLTHDPIATPIIDLVAQPNHVHEPAYLAKQQGQRRKDQIQVRIQPPIVLSRDSFSPIQDGVDPLELLDSEGAINVRNPIVVTKFRMLKPLFRTVTALVA